jgi:hypothetical protein
MSSLTSLSTFFFKNPIFDQSSCHFFNFFYLFFVFWGGGGVPQKISLNFSSSFTLTQIYPAHTNFHDPRTTHSGRKVIRCREKSIKDLSTILSISGAINCTILTISGSRKESGPFWQFLAPEMDHFCWFLEPEIVRMALLFSGSRNHQKGAISGPRNWHILFIYGSLVSRFVFALLVCSKLYFNYFLSSIDLDFMEVYLLCKKNNMNRLNIHIK